MEGQSKDIMKNDFLLSQSKSSYVNENKNIYNKLFENNIYTSLPSFKHAFQKNKFSDILNFLPKSENNSFKLPKCEKLNKILKKQTQIRDYALSKIKVIKKNVVI